MHGNIHICIHIHKYIRRPKHRATALDWIVPALGNPQNRKYKGKPMKITENDWVCLSNRGTWGPSGSKTQLNQKFSRETDGLWPLLRCHRILDAKLENHRKHKRKPMTITENDQVPVSPIGGLGDPKAQKLN